MKDRDRDATHGHFDVIEQALGQRAPVQVLARHLADRHVHRMVVVRRRHDQVRAHHLVVLVHAVVVYESAARRLDDADAARLPLAAREEVGPEEVSVVQQVLDRFGRVQHLDHARPVKTERGQCGASVVKRHELAPFAVGERRGNEIAAGDAGQRTDTVPAVLVAERAQVRELHVRPGLHFLGDLLPVVVVVHVIEDRPAVRAWRAGPP